MISALLSLLISVSAAPIEKRETTCELPKGNGIVSLATNEDGWAQDGNCKPGHWCQYACKPGYLMGQWDPEVKTYSYPGSQWGGVYCNEDGTTSKKVDEHDYCYEGKNTARTVNRASKDLAMCQTVLPGNEAMLIPTEVKSDSNATMAIPGTEYWAGTASHYYVNPPGVSIKDGCTWGSTAHPWGNWSPYVTGANMDDKGNTYAKIGWNPIYFEPTSPHRNTKPRFGLRMTCDDPSKCNGDPCEINPDKYGLNEVSVKQQEKSLGAAWCMVTATDYSGVTWEVFDL